jgi:hypothetical protein
MPAIGHTTSQTSVEFRLILYDNHPQPLLNQGGEPSWRLPSLLRRGQAWCKRVAHKHLHGTPDERRPGFPFQLEVRAILPIGSNKVRSEGRPWRLR